MVQCVFFIIFFVSSQNGEVFVDDAVDAGVSSPQAAAGVIPAASVPTGTSISAGVSEPEVRCLKLCNDHFLFTVGEVWNSAPQH